MNMLAQMVSNDTKLYKPKKLNYFSDNADDLEHFAAPVIHPITGDLISKYKTLAND